MDATGNADIGGNVYLAPARMNISGNAMVEGSVYEDASSAATSSGHASYSKLIPNQNLSSLVASIQSLASDSAKRAATQSFSSLGSQIVKGNGGVNVIEVSGDISLSGQQVLTLEGGASDVFIVNVHGSISVTGQASIQNSGGVLAANILFNVEGAGSDLSISGNGGVHGTFLAPNRGVKISGNGLIEGSVWAGGGKCNNISVTGNGLTFKAKPFCGGN